MVTTSKETRGKITKMIETKTTKMVTAQTFLHKSSGCRLSRHACLGQQAVRPLFPHSRRHASERGSCAFSIDDGYNREAFTSAACSLKRALPGWQPLEAIKWLGNVFSDSSLSSSGRQESAPSDLARHLHAQPRQEDGSPETPTSANAAAILLFLGMILVLAVMHLELVH